MLIQIKKKGKRLLSLLLALAMLLPCFTDIASATGTVASSEDISGYAIDMVIFNDLYRTGQSGQENIMSNEGVFSLSGNFAHNMTIGGVATEEDTSLMPKANDITVELAGLNVDGAVAVNPVFPETPNSNKTILNVTAASSLSKLILGENAVAELNVNADMEISELTLSKGSSLTINLLSSCKLTMPTTTGSGSLIISGGSVSGNSLTAGELTVSNSSVTMTAIRATGDMALMDATVTVPDGTVTAGSISAADTTINGAALFGFDAAVTGTANISFTNCYFINVDRVGASDDCTALVRFAPDCCVETEANSYVRDYTISYAVAEGAADEAWIRNYRFSSVTLNGEGTVISLNKTLPEYFTDGYRYQGWKLSKDAQEAITELTNQRGDLTLYPKTQAATISITMDLMFNLENENCDDAETWKNKYNALTDQNTHAYKTEQALDSSLTLDQPVRFGYTFGGWRLSGTETVIAAGTEAYQIIYGQLTDKENYTLKLEAVWNRDSFPLYWQFDGIDLQYMELSVDGGATWYAPKTFAQNHSALWTWEDSSSVMRTTTAGEILYGESLNDYFARLNSGWQFPVMRDKRSQDTDPAVVKTAQAFQTWYWNSQKMSVYATNTYDTAADTGILQHAKTAEMSWEQYQLNYLKLTNTIILSSVFGTANYSLTIPTVEGWTYWVDDVQTATTNGMLVVPNGAKVSLSCGVNSGLKISSWEFIGRTAVETAERYPGADVVYYDFTMPACDLTAIYTANPGAQYVDISKGAITFQDDFINPNSGISRDGFWHSERLVSGTSANHNLPLLGMTPLYHDAQKGYFYAWDNTKPLYVTSDGNATTNQLTLVQTSTVYFNAVNLAANEQFKTNAVDRTIYGESVEKPRDTAAAGDMPQLHEKIKAKGGLAPMGNVVLANDAQVAQTFTLSFIGEDNYVGAIFSDQYYAAASNSLKIQGVSKDSTTLKLGTAFTNCATTITNISLEEDEEIPCDYLLHVNVAYAGISVSRSRITAPHKEIYVKNSECHFGGDASADDATEVDIGVLVIGTTLRNGVSSKLRVRGDVHVGYTGMPIFQNSITVIDGNYLVQYFHRDQSLSRGAEGAVFIVKGNRCELGNVRWKAGTLICNALSLGRIGGIDGGIVVANTISNNPSRHWNILSGTTEIISYGGGTEVTENGDQYPFQTYAQASSGNTDFTFSGGEIYLLGDYKVNGNVYDTSVQVADTTVGPILAALLDTDGNYNGNAVSTADALHAVQNSSNKNKECVVLGASHLNTESISRTVNIKGNVKLYAAGNLNFFNDVNVSENAVVWCGGTFGTKNEMNITGGEITATEVGISYNMTTELEDSTTRWKKLTVSGGSITTDRIGTLSGYAYDNTVTVRGAAQINPSLVKPLSAQKVTLAFDEYVNYLLGTAGFTNPDSNLLLNSVHINGTIQNGVAGYAADAVSFAPPTYVGGTGRWKLGSAAGQTVTGVDTNAQLIGDTPAANAYDDDRLVLVAVKDEYAISVQNGAEYIVDLNEEGKVAQTTATAGSTVTIQITDPQLAADKTVVWYTDANGYLCNPGYTANDNTVTFQMPYYDVEIFVAPDGVELDLSKHHVTILPDGFRTHLDEVEEGQTDVREFHYTGNLTILQSAPKVATAYRIRVPADVNNISGTDSRTFTLKNLLQKSTQADIGLKLENGAKAHFTISGLVQLFRVEVPQLSEIILEGVERDYAVNQLFLNVGGDQEVENTVAFGIAKGKAGDMTVKNLKLLTKGNNFVRFGYSATKNSQSTLNIIGCSLDVASWYSASTLASNIGTVNIDDCQISYINAASWSSTVFSNCDNVNVTNSEITSLLLGSSENNETSFTYGINNQLTITDSTITSTLRNSTANTNYRMVATSDSNAPTVILNGNTVYNAEARSTFNKLILEGNSTFNAGGDAKNGYLFADTIEVKDNASLNAKMVLVSGYLTQSVNTIEKVRETLASTSASIKDGTNGGLFISGGAVNAESVGGDKNSVITVSGGQLNADNIGTLGALYGYGVYTPETHENWVESYAKVPTGATVTVTDAGVVNVGEYLGGMNAIVNIQGGTVNLQDGAKLGMTNSQAQTLKSYYATLGKNVADQKAKNITVNITGGEVLGDAGIINTPYGTTTINGANAWAKVQNISAVYGDVTISQSTDKYDNGLTGINEKVGVYVSDTLTAQNITINSNAKVYANNALADAPVVGDTAELNVLDTAVLYTNVYGSSGQGEVSIVGTEHVNIVQKQRQYSITYIMHDDTTDKAVNNALNVDTFTYDNSGKTSVPLYKPERPGYDFVRWYSYDAEGNIVVLESDSFNCSANYDVVLHAEWKPKEVLFKISVDTTKTHVGTAAEIASLGDAIEQSDGVVTFKDPVSIPYRADIFGTDGSGITLSNFSFPSYSILKLQVLEDDLTYELDISSATVTKELLNAYTKKNAPIELRAVSVTKKNELLIMDLNLDEDNRPVGAAFQENNASSSGNTIYARVAIGDTIASADGLVIDGELNKPTAPGYSFGGWYTNKLGTGEPIKATDVVGQGNTTFFAKWTPNLYKIRFDSNGGFVTQTNAAVYSGDSTMDAYAVYDAQIKGGISYVADTKDTQELPFAWKPGYHFVGWSIDDGKSLLDAQELNKATFGDAMNLEADDGVILTLKAVYTPVTVTYYTNEGIFTADWLTKTGAVQQRDEHDKPIDGWISEAKDGVVGYGLPLAGYGVNLQEATGGEYVLSDAGHRQVVGDKTFAVLSTSAQYYQNNESKYYSGDYRNDIGKKGYTFLGWNTEKDGTGTWIGTLPAYNDIVLYAQWSENSYTLTLNQGESVYSDLNTNGGPEPGQSVSVKVGQVIDGTLGTDTSNAIRDNWSDRTEWYAQAKSDLTGAKSDVRYLLGFTFDPLEPGAPSSIANDTTSAHSVAYLNYAASVTNLINNGALLSKSEWLNSEQTVKSVGSKFHLPANNAYNGDKITDTNVVPDYPDGYTIPMYAVYRERSLVFIQRYVDETNQVQETVMYSAPYNTYSNYPEIYEKTQEHKAVVEAGYKLVKWSVNDIQTGENYLDAKNLSQDEYTAKLTDWTTVANSKGSYDINIYTVYAASVSNKITLTTSKIPAADPVDKFDYSVPGSMVADYVQYIITDQTNGITFVNKDDLHPYDPDYVKQVAISMEFVDPDGNTYGDPIWLDDETAVSTGAMIGKGWTIRLKLYSSRVISQKEELSFKLNLSFQNQTAQQITLDTTVLLLPTEWLVNYTAELPSDPYLQVTNNGYSGTGNTRTALDYSWIYGSVLRDQIPAIEGYKGVGHWTDSNGATYKYGDPGNMELENSGAIALSTTYEKLSYQLTNKTDGKCDVQTTGSIPYHTAVTIKPGDTDPAFIWLVHKEEKYRLDQLAEVYPFYATKNDGVYTVLMPAGDVEVVYEDTMELYLGYGTIDLAPASYTQNGETVSWPGDYRILQWPNNIVDNAPTSNVLNLSGKLSVRNDGSNTARTIELGNLNIKKEEGSTVEVDDIIALAEGTEVVLTATGTITGRNILVPETASLTLRGAGQAVTLTPGADRAAIGGSGNTGNITLQDLTLTLNMPAASNASGIGPGSSDSASGGVITVNGCDITVNEENVVGKNPYSGTWIGGKEISTVNLNGTKLNKGDSESLLPMVDAELVNISNCTIGAEGAEVVNHMLRGGNININNSDIYLVGANTLLCPENVLSVDENSDDGSVISIIGAPAETLYRGVLKIFSPESDVVLWSNKLLDLSNGDITITEEGCTQNSILQAHSSAYRLLNSVNPNTDSTDVTVEGLKPNMFITVEAGCKIDKLTVSGDTDLRPLGLLPVTNVAIAEDTTLTVNAGENAGLNPETFGGDGSYSQKGGLLKSDNDLVVGGNMTLDGVTAETQKNVGSNGVSGVTTVTIKDSAITAKVIGATGEQPLVGNTAFVHVVVQGANTLDGTLTCDLYRLAYDASTTDFDLSQLPAVLRSQTVYTQNVAGVTTYHPEIPADPEYKDKNNESYFANWYILDNQNKMIAVSKQAVDGFDAVTVLNDTTVQYAQDTKDPNNQDGSGDGTKTLTLHLWSRLNGVAGIAYGRVLNELTSAAAKTVEIETNGAWTAQFNVEGAAPADAAYRFTFTTPIPAGTKLTLRFGTQNPAFYYYIPETDVTTVNESDFKRMGNESAADLITDADKTVEHTLQLSADFADVTAADNSVSLSVVSNSAEFPIESVSYTVKAIATANCQATENSVTYSIVSNGDDRLNGKTVYLAAKLQTATGEQISVPYTATLTYNGSIGTWIGGDTAFFALDDYQDMQGSGSWSVTGLNAGTYKVVWYLLAAGENTQNIFAHVLAKSSEITVTAVEQAQPMLTVTPVSVDDDTHIQSVLAAGEDHKVVFTYQTNAAEVQVMVETQRALKQFAAGNSAVADAAGTEVVIPGQKGVYRVRFSMDEFQNASSDWDDAYFTFIVK